MSATQKSSYTTERRERLAGTSNECLWALVTKGHSSKPWSHGVYIQQKKPSRFAPDKSFYSFGIFYNGMISLSLISVILTTEVPVGCHENGRNELSPPELILLPEELNFKSLVVLKSTAFHLIILPTSSIDGIIIY